MFSTTDGSVTVMMTFGGVCTCVGFEDGQPSISTTVIGMNPCCAEKDNVWLKNYLPSQNHPSWKRKTIKHLWWRVPDLNKLLFLFLSWCHLKLFPIDLVLVALAKKTFKVFNLLFYESTLFGRKLSLPCPNLY